MDYIIRNKKKIKKEDVISLYKNVGWNKYVEDIDKMMRAFNNSLLILSAWNENELLGLVRVVGDGETILYIQDLLVKKNAKRKGIATALVNQAIEAFPSVRQKVLITDDNPESVGFYKRIGFKDSIELNIKAFVKFEI